MKLKKGFKPRTICGEFILTPDSGRRADFNNMISMNPTARFLWESLQDRDFELDDMVGLLLGQYDVEDALARKDCTALIEEWTKAGLVE